MQICHNACPASLADSLPQAKQFATHRPGRKTAHTWLEKEAASAGRVIVEMVAKSLYALPMLPNICPTTLSQGRNVHANSSLSCFAPTNVVCRLHRRHGHTIRTSLNATESSQQHQPQSAEQLQHELQDAILVENYEKAAELRDALKSLQPSDSAPALKKKMDQLVSQDNFEVAALRSEQIAYLVMWKT